MTQLIEFLDVCSRHARYFVAGVLVLVNVLLLSILASSLHTSATKPANNTKSLSSFAALAGGSGSSSNVVTDLLVAVSDVADQVINTANNAAVNAAGSVSSVAANFGQVVVGGLHDTGSFVVHTTATALSAGAQGLGAAAHFVWRIPFAVMGVFNSSPAVNAFVVPASAVPVPVIDVGRAGMLPPAQPSAHTASQATPTPAKATPQWPIHGSVTTRFGVPEPPFQPIHTGVDISDGTAPGTTTVHPFMPGRVVSVIHSPYGLGNHVIIDHGNGLTSVYGHMSVASVVTGQMVSQDAVLGYEGSTGASTGTHLHFEIRQDGVAHNPFDYISGQP